MENQDKESKTEAPTEKRIKDSLDEGKVPVSRDVAGAATLLALYAVYVIGGEDIAQWLSVQMTMMVDSSIGAIPLSNRDFGVLLARIGVMFASLLGPLLLALMLAALVAAAAQNEPRFIIKRITPQYSRISLSEGWKRLFSAKSFVEFLKSCAKIGGAMLVVTAAMLPIFKNVMTTMHQAPMASLLSISAMVASLLAWVAAVAALIAAADFAWQRYAWWSDMKMSRQELKDEHKQAEGDPVIKGRMRSISRDRVRSRMMRAVPSATMVVANPTHFAVALRYDQEKDAAPVVVAKGADLLALRIRALAEENSVPVFERVELARALYKSVKVDQILPVQFYKAIAELVRAVYDKRVQ